VGQFLVAILGHLARGLRCGVIALDHGHDEFHVHVQSELDGGFVRIEHRRGQRLTRRQRPGRDRRGDGDGVGRSRCGWHELVGDLPRGAILGRIAVRNETGTPQGGVISPILANIFLHTVLDEWFEKTVRACMGVNCFLVRFAGDKYIRHEPGVCRAFIRQPKTLTSAVRLYIVAP
jgi:hypothetical protein